MIGTRVAVRRARPDDLDAVIDLRLSLLREHDTNAIYRRVRPDARARARGVFLAQLRADREVTFLAEADGTVVGILRCIESLGHPLLFPEAYAYVSSVYVRPEARRRGVLRALLAAAEHWARERALPEMRLHNAAENPAANAAWLALGFEVVEHLRLKPL